MRWWIVHITDDWITGEVVAIPIIMQSTVSNPKTIKFRSNLGFTQINLILTKEQWIVIPLLKAFSAEKLDLQHKNLKEWKSKNWHVFLSIN